MAENYSLGSGFGFNILNKGASKTPVEKTTVDLKSTMGSLFNSVGDYFEKNEKVFNGDVEREIGMYSRQMMIVGMNLKAADNNIRRFDMNI